MSVSDEVPRTKDGLAIYIKEVYKRLDQLSPAVQESGRLKTRLKLANKRLNYH